MLQNEIVREVVNGVASDTERVLQVIWSQLLDVRPVERDDTFPGVGGTPASAAACAWRIEESLHVRVPVSILERPVPLRVIASLIDAATRSPEREVIADYALLRCAPDECQ